MLIAGLGGHVEEVFDVLIVKIVVDEAGMPSNSRRYGRQWAPVFEGFEGLLRCDLWWLLWRREAKF